MSLEDTKSLAQKLSKQPPLGPVREVSLMDPDVSARRYYRVFYSAGERSTAILAYMPDGEGPLGGGAGRIQQREAFVEIQQFFKSYEIPVPNIFSVSREERVLLLEDLGDRFLSGLIASPEVPLEEKRRFMMQTIDVLARIQSIPCTEEGTPLSLLQERKPQFEQLRKGPLELSQFYLRESRLTASEHEIFEEFACHLSEEISSHPSVCCHYDFTGYNVHVRDSDELALIDFQDACLESPARDLHAILCDRDMARHLEQPLHKELFEYALKKLPGAAPLRPLYCEYAVHWDMRVAGRFAKLAFEDGRTKYEQWIPHTVGRLVHELEAICKKFDRAADVLDVLLRKAPVAREYAKTAWSVTL